MISIRMLDALTSSGSFYEQHFLSHYEGLSCGLNNIMDGVSPLPLLKEKKYENTVLPAILQATKDLERLINEEFGF